MNLLFGVGHVLFVLLIATGIAILICNTTVQAGELGKPQKRGVGVLASPQPRESEAEVRVRLREPGAR